MTMKMGCIIQNMADLTIIKYFLDIIAPSNHLKQNLLDLLSKYPSADKKAMGFPDNWEKEDIWSY